MHFSVSFICTVSTLLPKNKKIKGKRKRKQFRYAINKTIVAHVHPLHEQAGRGGCGPLLQSPLTKGQCAGEADWTGAGGGGAEASGVSCWLSRPVITACLPCAGHNEGADTGQRG